ncbi:MAG: T9SS type A sorting domain-containing protein [Flavobacterium lindanitolerans]|uniref:T9SS type A sorting domain-containing protein n=1 Tax=Flavobacterium lindanitolerans TaxID=428988 RepID=UPI001A4640FD|nr:T9SS type A sorting domain-containing protein [Flavobacterium lindanitolerans]MBL7867643.1 T9SS type A sorting domain-containing protein [Flavobacterium lindanitolerans]
MKKTLLFLILILYGIRMDAQCWKSISFCTGIKTDGTLWKWGSNHAGQIGNGTYISTNLPVKIGTDINWKVASCTDYFTAAIKTDGTLWTWGENSEAQLGLGDSMIRRTIPTQVGTETNWKTVSAGQDHCLAIKTDGTLWMWGLTGTTGGLILSPIQVGTDTDWEQISAGLSYSLAIKSNGTLWSWGRNQEKLFLGLGSSAPDVVNSPTQIGSDTNWIAIATGNTNPTDGNVNFALKSNGTLWGWGKNASHSPLGDGTATPRYIPVQIGSDNDWAKISLQSGIKNNGTLWAWGKGHIIGIGNTSAVITPIQIGTDTDWKAINNNLINFLKIKGDGLLWNSGMNNDGELGSGSTSPTLSLVSIQVLTTNCPPPIIANDDLGTALNGLANTAITNVLSNDTFNGNPATFPDVTLSFISSTHSGITLNTSTGAVNVSATVPIGTYTLNYQICQSTSLSNCDTATVTITVNPQTIDAVNDNFSGTPIDYLTGGVTPSLLTNDIVNGAATNPAEVILTLTNNGGIAGASINANGAIDIPVGTLINTYTLQYSICLISNPSICDTASVIVTVADRIITTPEIVFAIRANNVVDQSQLQSTGKIIISGGFTKYNNVDARYLMRLNTDLTYDTTFPALGSSPHEPEDFKVLPNDKIIVVGTFTSINGTPTPRGIARLNADGTVDTSFNVGGTGIDAIGRIISCAIQSDGKILLGGGFIHSYNGVLTRNMIRLNSDGTLDTSFVYPYTYAPSTFGSIHEIVVLPDGKILVSGNQSRAADALGNYIGQPHIFRLNADGSLDSTFTTWFVDSTHSNTNFCSSCIAPIQNMVLQPDGKIIIVGSFVSFNYIRRRDNIVRLNSNGTLDSTFLPNKSHTTSNRAIKDAVIEPSGKIIIGGEFTTFNGLTNNKLARLNTDGALDITFSSEGGPTYGNYLGTVYDLNRQADGKVIVSGSFSHYNNISATNITRIAPEIPGSQARGNGLQLWNTEKEIGNNVQTTIGEISIYPNPSSGIFSVDLTQSKEPYTTIMVYNALGQKVYQTNSVPESVNEIDLSNLPDGYYYAQITGGKSSVQKVLIKK